MATVINARDVALRGTSPRVAATTYTAPGDVTSFTYTIEQFGARLKWLAVSDPTAVYELRTGGTSWDTSTFLAETNSTSYFLGLTFTGSLTIRIKAHNKVSELYSTNAVSQVVSAPAAPAPTVVYDITGVNEKLSWTFPSTFNFTLDHFEIRYGGTSWATSTFLASTKSTYIERKVDYVGARKYWVAGIDAANNLGTPTTVDVIIVGPGNITGTRADVVDNNVLLYWNAPTTGSLPIDTYEIRKGPSWAGYTSIIGSNADSTFTTVFEQSSGTYNYWVGAYDSAGNLNTPVSITATVSQPPDYVLRQNYNSIFASYSGVTATLTNMYVEGAGILGPVLPQTWAAHYTSNGWNTPADQISAGYPIYANPSTTSGSFAEVFDVGGTIAASVITATINTTTIVGAVTVACQIYWKLNLIDPWTPATAGVTSVLGLNFRYVQVVWNFNCTAGANLIKVNAINVTLANKLKTDSGSYTITNAAAGVVVPFNIAFVDADTPICQPNGVGSDNKQLTPVVSFADVPNPVNFTVFHYNYTSGAKETGSGAWAARGY